MDVRKYDEALGMVAAEQDGCEPLVFAKRPSARALGRMGEDEAVQSLVRRGFELVERNWECRFGEADIIVRDQDGTTAFVEVKTRYSLPGETQVFPELAVDAAKLERYRKIALYYLGLHPRIEAIRFDVIAVNLTGPGQGHLRHLIGAHYWDY